MFLFCEITKIIIIELIYIKSINNKCKNELKNIINLKKTSIIHNIKQCFGVIVKSNIVFITSNGRNGKKMLSNLTEKNDKNSLLGNNVEFLI